jgi:hypothetical protein
MDLSRRPLSTAFETLHVLDENLLNEPIGFLHVDIVIALSGVSYLLQLDVPKHLACLAKGLEGVFRLPGHYDITNESQEIAFASGIRKVPCGAKRGADKLLPDTRLGPELRLILLEHSLMLAHIGNVPGAQVAETSIFRLALVILERLEKGLMLHNGVVDLAFQKIDAAVHGFSRIVGLAPR